MSQRCLQIQRTVVASPRHFWEQITPPLGQLQYQHTPFPGLLFSLQSSLSRLEFWVYISSWMCDRHLSTLKLGSFSELSFQTWEGDLFSSSEGSGPWPLICQTSLPLEAISLFAGSASVFLHPRQSPSLQPPQIMLWFLPPLHLLEMK